MWHDTKKEYSHARNIGKLVLALFIVAWLSARSEAQLFYNFVQQDSGEIVATLELTSLPATHEGIDGLTFTPHGEAIFGYGPTYTGTFDSSSIHVVDDGSDGLDKIQDVAGFLAGIYDTNPPVSTIFGELSRLTLLFSATEDAFFSWPQSGPVVVLGDWRLVPEPRLSGDYNNDGVVNTADYTAWRDNLGALVGPLPNDIDGGVIGQAQYATWKANFGMTADTPVTLSTGVPEPPAVWLLMSALVLIGGAFPRR